MKKIIKFSLFLVLLFTFVSCSATNSLTNSVKKVKSIFKADSNYNNVKVTFVTTQGDIEFFLYPEAAPITVANFINLAKRGFYDNTKFNRAVENFVVQGGDPTGTGFGGPGYTIIDETVNWLDFYQPGMLAMANAGPNTGGSQFFFTLYPADWLNGLHTVFGEARSEADLIKIKKLEVGDVIKKIEFDGDVDFILALNKNLIESWNPIIDQNYPNLKTYPIRDLTAEEEIAYREEIEKLYTRENEKRKNSFEYPTTQIIRGIFNKLGNYKPRDFIITE